MSLFAKQSSANALATGGFLIAGLLSTVISARILGPDGLGAVAYAAWVVGLMLTVSDLGIPGALARYLPELNNREQTKEQAGALTAFLLRNYVWSVITVSLFFLVCLEFYLNLRARDLMVLNVRDYISSPVFWGLVVFSFVCQSASPLLIGLLRGLQDFEKMAKIMIASGIVQVVGTLAGAYYYGLVGALLASASSGMVPAYFLFKNRLSGVRLAVPLKARVQSYCVQTWISYMLFSLTMTRTEIFFLERSWGGSYVALYSVGLTIANVITQGALLLAGPLLPHFAKYIGNEDRVKLANSYRAAIKFVALLVFPACLGMIAICPSLINYVYGVRFSGAALPSSILLIGAVFSSITAIAQVLMSALEKTIFNVYVGALGALTMVACGILIMPDFGILGASISRMLISFFVMLISLIYVRTVLRFGFRLLDIAKILLAATVSGCFAYTILLISPGGIGILFSVLGGVVAYLLALKMVKALSASDVSYLRRSIGERPSVFASKMNRILDFYSA